MSTSNSKHRRFLYKHFFANTYPKGRALKPLYRVVPQTERGNWGTKPFKFMSTFPGIPFCCMCKHESLYTREVYLHDVWYPRTTMFGLKDRQASIMHAVQIQKKHRPYLNVNSEICPHHNGCLCLNPRGSYWNV